ARGSGRSGHRLGGAGGWLGACCCCVVWRVGGPVGALQFVPVVSRPLAPSWTLSAAVGAATRQTPRSASVAARSVHTAPALRLALCVCDHRCRHGPCAGRGASDERILVWHGAGTT